MEVIVQDIKPEVSSISSTESSSGPTVNQSTNSNIGPKYLLTTSSVQGTPATNNNTIRILTQNQKLTAGNTFSSAQTPIFVTSTGGIQGASGVGGSGTVYITGGSAGSVTPSPVRTTSTILAVGQQQLQTMAKSPGLSIVHVTLPQSVIQSPSVIQSASGQLQLSKANVILVSKPSNSSVIQTTSGAIQTVQLLNSPHQLHSDESLSNDGVDRPGDTAGRSSVDRKRREILTRRPSYRKILNDLGGAEITGDKGDSSPTSDSSQDPLDNSSSGNIIIGGSQYPQSVVKVINANTLGLSGTTTADATGSTATALQTITMTNAGTAGGTIVQYAQSQDGQQFFVPVGGELQAYTIRPVSSASSSPSVVVHGASGHHPPEEVTRKREIRLLKNREAARECRRKKKEYIKCLENRVAVLENQNKALIDELKSLKELYCQQKTE